MSTKIEWATETWNPITGCTKISEGCQNCYAERMSKRLAGRCGYPKDNPFAVTLHPDKLDQPMHWRKPRMIFVCSMGDLFHKKVSFDYLDMVFEVIEKCPQHTFLILTKRPEDAELYFNGYYDHDVLPSNVWLGVTAENQQRADERIPILLQIPAAKRFVSIEPMLGAVDLKHLQPNREVEIDCLSGTHGVSRPHGGSNEKLDWVICGGESGPRARPMHPDWARSLRDQCKAAEVPFFFKQWGEWAGIDQPWEQESVPDLRENEQWLNIAGGQGFHGDKVWRMRKVGKKAAGRLLDGREWNEYPEVSA